MLANEEEGTAVEETNELRNDRSLGVPVESTRTLGKAYRFYKDGHVQQVKYHPMPKQDDHICITAKVLPSMKKNRMYRVVIIICETSVKVSTAYCSCPAGLAGCCNHISATLYCLEDYISQRLYEDEEKGCTERLQVWSQSKPPNVEPRPTDEVKLTKHVYGVEKRVKLHTINQWDCRPVSRRIVNPNKARSLRERLCAVQQSKADAAETDLVSATNEAEKKKAYRSKYMIEKYGICCFLQLLDNEPAPVENRAEILKQERLALAEAKRRNFRMNVLLNCCI